MKPNGIVLSITGFVSGMLTMHPHSLLFHIEQKHVCKLAETYCASNRVNTVVIPARLSLTNSATQMLEIDLLTFWVFLYYGL